MWDSSCSGNTQKTNLWQLFAVVHWVINQGALLENFKENDLAKVSFLTLFRVGGEGENRSPY